MADEQKLSKIEAIKTASEQLRGTVAAELENDSDHFEADTVQILKHHGTYQQDNRDARAAKKGQKSSKQYGMLIRTRVPGGRLTSQQLLSELEIGEELGDGTLRITSRQGLQLHGVPKKDLRQVIQRINQIQLSTLGACGDVNRNVMCCPAAFDQPKYAELRELTLAITDRFAPRTEAYREIWLLDPETGEKEPLASSTATTTGPVEPLYGQTYLPRKFKIGIALPEDNCIDIYTHDLGLLAISDNGHIQGYNVLVGGGMGQTPSNKNTYPALGLKMAFVSPDRVLDVAEAIIKVQRDHGNRVDRKQARMKYLVRKLGLDAFRELVEQQVGFKLEPPHSADVTEVNDHIGWEDQGNDRWCYGLNIENGRLADTTSHRLKTAVRKICQQLDPDIRLTANQSLLFANLKDQDRATLEQILREHDVPLSEQCSTVRRWSMACVALPTCGLAITESERALPGVIDELELALTKWGLSQEAFVVRMTGCPNGCSRPYNADIGLVGKARGRYTMFLGGNRLGTQLNFVYRDLVPREEIVSTLTPLFAFFKQSRGNGESFGDFCHRQGLDNLQSWAEKFSEENGSS
jgi:sulfite reductase (ferredoxin)